MSTGVANVEIDGQFARPPAAVVEALGAMGPALLADSMAGRNVMDPRLRPVAPGQRVAGPAITASLEPGDNLSMHVALHLAQPGDVIVLTAPAPGSTGLWGDLATTSAIARGVAGVVADGAVRDAATIRERGFPVWSAALSPRGANKGAFGTALVPVSCGGVLVAPGDVIVADDDGVVVVPLARVGEVRATAAAKEAREAELRALFEQGATPFDALGMAPALEAQGVTLG
jgi:4-hydroxy-4-methyl-2-oxoglutarate aldolase